MNDRVARLRGTLPAELDGLLVTDATNVRYLSGFVSTNAVLLVGRESVALLTDGRYVEAARSVPDVELVESSRDIAQYLGEHLHELLPGQVGFEAASLSYSGHARIAQSDATLVATNGLVQRVRAVKDADELDAVRRSAALLNDVFDRLSRERFTGRTEAEVAWWVERTIRERGAEAISFPPIVGSGPNAALPHHHPDGRVIGPSETVVVDAGAVVDGYCSDCTRTFATGPLSPGLQRAYDVCLDAQLRSLEAVKAGASCQRVDAISRAVLREHGYETVHGLGHAVGLEIHEDPRLNDVSTDSLESGNVVTVEPGIYLPGTGGVRIEDIVIVTEDGAEVLTPFTKELVTVA